MATPPPDLQRAAREAAYSMPLDQINPNNPELFRSDTIWPYFERLRAEDPVHWAVDSNPHIGGYWSVTKYKHIVEVDTEHAAFSSEPSILLEDDPEYVSLPMFIAMDPPKHDAQRKTVQPIVAPNHLAHLEPIIRERAAKILDELPIGEEFDWVDQVSIELTTMTLATLFDFPWPDRRKLTRWSDVATASAASASRFFGPGDWRAHRYQELTECLDYFTRLWNERANAPPRPDLISMLAHSDATQNMERMEYLGNLSLLIVAGNDTTRNSITASVLALHQNPDQDRMLRADPVKMIPHMIAETIRWQTPLAYMRRRATRNIAFAGKTIREGDKIAMWYVSGNRDEDAIERPNDYWIGRPRVRQHLSVGSGIHRCLGSSLAELQLKIIWEEILARFPRIEVVGPPRRVASAFVRGYEHLPVVIPRRN
jgi:cytochrome P450